MLKLDLVLVDTHDPRTIAFGDISQYGNKVLSNVSFEVTPPGYPKKNILFTPREVNIFNGADLGVNCEVDSMLPDGIYTVKYSIRPNAQLYVEKSFMNISSILCKLYKFVLTLPKDSLLDIRLLLDSSVSAANLGQCELAYDFYRQAVELFNQADCQNC